MRRRRAGLAAACLAIFASLVGGSPAEAGKNIGAKTYVSVFTFTVVDAQFYLLGAINSPDSRCLANRKVKISLRREAGGSTAIDVARTSDAGGWLGSRLVDEVVPDGPFTADVIEVAPRKIRISKHKTLNCKRAKLVEPILD